MPPRTPHCASWPARRRCSRQGIPAAEIDSALEALDSTRGKLDEAYRDPATLTCAPWQRAARLAIRMNLSLRKKRRTFYWLIATAAVLAVVAVVQTAIAKKKASEPSEWITYTCATFGFDATSHIEAVRPYDSGSRRLLLPRRRSHQDPSTKYSYPAWSPDGQYIAFASGVGTQFITIMDVHSGELTRLSEAAEGTHSRPSWSPSGEWIAFLATSSQPLSIYIIRPDGSGLRRLTTTTDTASPSWSADGTQVVYTTEGDVYTYSLVDGRIDLLLADERELASPVWSPTGEYLAVLEVHSQGGKTLTAVRLYEETDKGLEQIAERLVSRTIFQSGLAWSPDGEWLAVTVGLDEQELYVIRAGGDSIPIRITATDGCTPSNPSWSPGRVSLSS